MKQTGSRSDRPGMGIYLPNISKSQRLCLTTTIDRLILILIQRNPPTQPSSCTTEHFPNNPHHLLGLHCVTSSRPQHQHDPVVRAHIISNENPATREDGEYPRVAEVTATSDQKDLYQIIIKAFCPF
jgi:hypothetical protein